MREIETASPSKTDPNLPLTDYLSQDRLLSQDKHDYANSLIPIDRSGSREEEKEKNTKMREIKGEEKKA